MSDAASVAWANAHSVRAQLAAQRARLSAAGAHTATLADRLRAVQDKLAAWPAGAETQAFTAAERGQAEAADLSLPQARQLQADLTEQLHGAREAEGMQATLLQELTQAFERACTLASQLLRAGHETLMAIINNLR